MHVSLHLCKELAADHAACTARYRKTEEHACELPGKLQPLSISTVCQGVHPRLLPCPCLSGRDVQRCIAPKACIDAAAMLDHTSKQIECAKGCTCEGVKAVDRRAGLRAVVSPPGSCLVDRPTSEHSKLHPVPIAGCKQMCS